MCDTLCALLSPPAIQSGNTKHETQNTKCKTQNTKCETQNTTHETQNTKNEKQNTKHKTRVAECQSFYTEQNHEAKF